MDIEKLSGPITRNRQQLIAEQEQLLGLAHSRLEERKADKLKDESSKIASQNQDQRSPFIMDYKDQKGGDRHGTRSTPDPNRPPPRLTLKSLTNMEDPFTNSSASNFRPPYLRHTGLLSISKDHPNSSVLTLPSNPSELNPAPIRPEPVRSGARTLGDLGNPEYLPERTSYGTHLHPNPQCHDMHQAGAAETESVRGFEHNPPKVSKKVRSRLFRIIYPSFVYSVYKSVLEMVKL